MPVPRTTVALLAAADALIADAPDGDGPLTPAARDRGAAYALRIALEACVDATLTARVAGLDRVTMRAKLLCLRHYVGTGPARRAGALWNRLSTGCKYHHDEIGPSHAHVRAWRTAVAALAAELAAPPVTEATTPAAGDQGRRKP